MKKSAVALAALFALTSAAFAENPNVGGQQDQPRKAVTIDLQSTQSIRDADQASSERPAKGMAVDPWFITNFH